MITKEEFIELVANTIMFDGSTEYKQTVALAKDEGLRLNNSQVWLVINEAKAEALQAVDW
jgi:hypothetical protein